MDGDSFGEIVSQESYPADDSSMAGGKETHYVLPLALVHSRLSREVQTT